LSPQQKCDRIAKIVEKAVVLLMRHSNNQLYTPSTFLFDEGQEELQLNVTSFVGLELMLCDQKIGRKEFEEIYELLGSTTLKRKRGERFWLGLKFRALGKILLDMLLERTVKINIDWQTG
jgi:hypothetical protein